MMPSWPYRQLADAVLVLHFVLVLFVVGGLAAVVAGNLLRWRWVNGMGFRVAHGGAIAVVVAQAWLGIACPLTTLESWLRGRAGGAGYDAGFIEHWVQRLLYWDAPSWVFVLVYTVFGLAVLLSWWAFPPRARQRPDGSGV
jgi:pheromone shutdown protein TraB